MSPVRDVRAEIAEIFDEVLSLPMPELDQDLVASGLLDSMAIVAIVVELEVRFEIELTADDLDLTRLGTIRGMSEVVLAARPDLASGITEVAGEAPLSRPTGERPGAGAPGG